MMAITAMFINQHCVQQWPHHELYKVNSRSQAVLIPELDSNIDRPGIMKIHGIASP